jgi:hypothetical protein
MTRIRSQTWKTILIVALVILVVGMLVSGLIGWFIAILIVLLAMGGGALLNRTLGPPTR